MSPARGPGMHAQRAGPLLALLTDVKLTTAGLMHSMHWLLMPPGAAMRWMSVTAVSRIPVVNQQ